MVKSKRAWTLGSDCLDLSPSSASLYTFDIRAQLHPLYLVSPVYKMRLHGTCILGWCGGLGMCSCFHCVRFFATPWNCSLPVSSVHGIVQARILEWGAISSSRGSSWSRDWTLVSYISCIGRQGLLFFSFLTTEPPGKPGWYRGLVSKYTWRTYNCAWYRVSTQRSYDYVLFGKSIKKKLKICYRSPKIKPNIKQRGPSKLNNYLSIFICITTNSQILDILLKDSLMGKKYFIVY